MGKKLKDVFKLPKIKKVKKEKTVEVPEMSAEVVETKVKAKKKFNFDFNIKAQLLVGFAIPVVFVVLVGMISSNTAEEGAISNYEVSAQNTIDTQMKFFDFGFSLIRADAVQIKLDKDLQSLMAGTFKNNPSKASTVNTAVNTDITVKANMNGFINNIYIVPKSDQNIISTTKILINSNQQPKGFYETWAKTEEGKAVHANDFTGWISSHVEMDTMTTYDSSEYILSFMAPLPNKSSVLVVDISKEKVAESLADLDTSGGAILGFVTADGKEVIVKDETTPTEIVFNQQEFYQNAINSGELSGVQYITYNHKEYLFIYRTSEETGATLTYMVPREKVTASAAGIRNITLILVIVACIVATLIGLGISLNITNSMGSIIKRLKKVAEGDLTVQMKTKGRSEFAMLNRHIADMIENTRKLIVEVEGIVNVVNVSAEDVEGVSGQLEQFSNGILNALEEIDIGVSQQANDAQDCLVQMDNLSQVIEEVTEDIGKTADNSESTKEVVTKSISTMEVLSNQTKDTIEITSKVKEDVKLLEVSSNEIKKFVAIIADIAEQTNLLSLNASIEAARAGEAGRGFSVVAEEIRKLADGSRQAAEEIGRVVENIEKQTNDTVETAMRAETIVEEQAETVNATKKAFHKIYDATEEVIASVDNVKVKVKGMDKERGGTLEAISSISAVSEQTSASSSNVFAIAENQKDTVSLLTKASNELKSNMEELKQAVSVFKTTEE